MFSISVCVVLLCLARHCNGIPTNRVLDLESFEDATPARRPFTSNDFKGKYSRFMELSWSGHLCPKTLELLSNGIVLAGDVEIPHNTFALNKKQCNSEDILTFRFGKKLAIETIENVFKLPMDAKGYEAIIRDILMHIRDFYYGVEEKPISCGGESLFAGTAILFTSDSDVFGQELRIPFHGHPKMVFMRDDQKSCAYNGTWTSTQSATAGLREQPLPVSTTSTSEPLISPEMAPAAAVPGAATSADKKPVGVPLAEVSPAVTAMAMASATVSPTTSDLVAVISPEVMSGPDASSNGASSEDKNAEGTNDKAMPEARVTPSSLGPTQEASQETSESTGVNMLPPSDTVASSTIPLSSTKQPSSSILETTEPDTSNGPSSSNGFVLVLPSAKPIASMSSGEGIGEDMETSSPTSGILGSDFGSAAAIPSPDSTVAADMTPLPTSIPVDLTELTTPSSSPTGSEVSPLDISLGSPAAMPSPTLLMPESVSSPEPSFMLGSTQASPTPNRITSATSDDGSACFPSRALARLSIGKPVRLDELRVGDLVHVGGGKVSTVVGFSHSDRHVISGFIRFTTDSGNSITLTPTHYMHTSRGLVAGGAIIIGDCLHLEDGRITKVLEIEGILERGLFNPHTAQGDIVIDGFIASTYTSAVEPGAAHALLAPIRVLARLGIRSSVVSYLSSNPWIINSARYFA